MFKNDSGNYRLKIAFDFDDTLTNRLFFVLARHFILKGHDVWIMTARYSNESYLEACKISGIPAELQDTGRNGDLLEMARELGLEDKIIYTSCEDKTEFFFNEQFDLLFDDDGEWHCDPICKAGGLAINI